MLETLIGYDTDVFLWINSIHIPFWDVFMKMATGKLIWTGLYLSILFALWRSYGWKTLIIVFLMSCLSITISDQLTASVLRPVFERLRPSHPENPISDLVHIVDNYRGGRYGFPSSHAANTFAAATLLSLVFKRSRFTVAIFIWAIINCYSRLYLGVHYPGDILFGIILGVLSGLICYLMARFILLKWVGKRAMGKTDHILEVNFQGKRFKFRSVDIVIIIEIMTISAILFCSYALLRT